MRNVIVPFLLVFACHANAAPQHAPSGNLEELVVVGRLIEIEELPSDCPVEPQVTPEGNEIMCIRFDEVFRARYEILEAVAGTPASREVTFLVADHYGVPEFARYEAALLFLGRDEEGWFLHKDKGFQMQRTDDGDWAHCGKPHGGLDLTPEPIAFSQDFGGPQGQRLPEEEVGNYWLDDPQLAPYVSVEGQRIHCRKGVRLSALYSAVLTSLGSR